MNEKKDHIKIDRLEVYAYHGVYAEEQEQGQHFYISADMETDLHAAGIHDDLTASTHYGEVSEYLKCVCTEQKYQLIESVAEECATRLLIHYPLITGVTLTVSKPEAPIQIPFQDVSVSIYRCWHKAYVAYGSNLGDRKKWIEDALLTMQKNPKIRKIRISSLYETKPYGGVEQDDFLNGVCELETLLTPQELLEYLHTLENAAGRTREVHWGPRTLDLDIIFYDSIILETPDLTIPHPDMQNRDFVLEPLSELTRYYIHPVNHCSIAALLAASNVSTKSL